MNRTGYDIEALVDVAIIGCVALILALYSAEISTALVSMGGMLTWLLSGESMLTSSVVAFCSLLGCAAFLVLGTNAWKENGLLMKLVGGVCVFVAIASCTALVVALLSMLSH